jgi:hypothetical protein
MRGQKWHQSRGFPLSMCRQGRFFIFNQAPSFNLQTLIQRCIIGRNWRFSPEWASNISFLPLEKVHFL